MKNLFNWLYAFLMISYRQIIYRITNRKMVASNVYVDAPIGIIGQPNKITWDVQNILYAKVIYRSKKRIITQNAFHFTNDLSTQNVEIIFYGIKEKTVKKIELYFIKVQKTPPPEPIFKKEYRLNLKSEFKSKNVFPSLKPSFSLKPSTSRIKNNIPEIANLKIEIPPLDISELTEEILKVEKEKNLNTLTKTIKDEKRLLPQSDPRPYHEVIMESRWFG